MPVRRLVLLVVVLIPGLTGYIVAVRTGAASLRPLLPSLGVLKRCMLQLLAPLKLPALEGIVFDGNALFFREGFALLWPLMCTALVLTVCSPAGATYLRSIFHRVCLRQTVLALLVAMLVWYLVAPLGRTRLERCFGYFASWYAGLLIAAAMLRTIPGRRLPIIAFVAACHLFWLQLVSYVPAMVLTWWLAYVLMGPTVVIAEYITLTGASLSSGPVEETLRTVFPAFQLILLLMPLLFFLLWFVLIPQVALQWACRLETASPRSSRSGSKALLRKGT